VFYEAFKMTTASQSDVLTTVSFANLKNAYGTDSFAYAFQNRSNITILNFPNLEALDGTRVFFFTFENCTSLQTVTFPKLNKVRGSDTIENIFRGCTSLTSVSFPALVTIESTSTRCANSPFYDCSSLQSVSLPVLQSLKGTNTIRKFLQNTPVTTISFPSLTTCEKASLTDAFADSSLTEAHFPASMQATIEACTNYSTNFGRGAGNMTIYFDL
jgi:hypothetical protein